MLEMGIAPAWLPPFNTGLIGVSGVCALIGYVLIRTGHRTLHKWAMLTATTFATLFLVVYVYRALMFETRTFSGDGLTRVIYLTVLVTHTILAIAVGPMVLLTIYRALRKRYDQHKQLGRVTLPTWLYVVVSGWLVFLMLYS